MDSSDDELEYFQKNRFMDEENVEINHNEGNIMNQYKEIGKKMEKDNDTTLNQNEEGDNQEGEEDENINTNEEEGEEEVKSQENKKKKTKSSKKQNGEVSEKKKKSKESKETSEGTLKKQKKRKKKEEEIYFEEDENGEEIDHSLRKNNQNTEKDKLPADRKESSCSRSEETEEQKKQDQKNNSQDQKEPKKKKEKVTKQKETNSKSGYFKTKAEAQEDAQIGSVGKKPYLRMSDIEISEFKLTKQHKIMIEDTEIYFPYEPYEQQKQYMTEVIKALNKQGNALLQSPTGTGKTLCLLCASLAWLKKKRMEQKQNNEKHPVRIVYSSRTHSQLQQVVKELKETVYNPRMSVLASRDQYCLKKEFQLLTGGLRVTACQKACKGDDPMTYCKYFRGYQDDDQAEFVNEIQDIEDLKLTGECKQFCPYFYSRRFRDAVDLLFLPYNYLLENSSAQPFTLDLTNAVLIFDEAHNVQKVAEDGSSFSISNFHLESMEKEIAILRDILQTYPNPKAMKRAEEQKKNIKINPEEDGPPSGFKSNSAICYQILSVSKALKQWMMKEMAKHKFNNSTAAEGKHIFNILRDFARTGGDQFGSSDPKWVNIKSLNNKISKPEDDQDNKDEKAEATSKKHDSKLNPFLEGITATSIDKYLEFLGKALDDMPNSQNYGLDQFLAFLKLVKQLFTNDAAIKADSSGKTWVDNLVNNYKLLIDINPDKQECQLFLQCLDSSQGFTKLREKGIYNMLFTSGTLSPMDSWSAELKMPFPFQISSTHVIQTGVSLLAGILDKGPEQRELEFTYHNRGNNPMIDDLGLILLNLIKYIPNGVLVIFNSTSTLEMCRQRWMYGETKIMKKLMESKFVVFEPQHSFELAQAMDQYSKNAHSPRGAILFAVCRGKISEGLDFSDELARAVFIVGVPYPPAKEPRVTNKKSYLDSIYNDKGIKGDKISGTQWYLQQAIRAMNQAIGRVIRHKNDWGAVFLCDKRFKMESIKNEISDWVKVGNGLKEFPNFPAALVETKSFFDSKPKSSVFGNQKKKMLLSSTSASANQNTDNFYKNQLSRNFDDTSEQSSQNQAKIPLKRPFTIPQSDNHKRQSNDYSTFEKISLNGQKQMKMTDFKTTKVPLKADEFQYGMQQQTNTSYNQDGSYSQKSSYQSSLSYGEKPNGQKTCGAFHQQYMQSEESTGNISMENLAESKREQQWQPKKNPFANLKKVQSKNIQDLIMKQSLLRREEEEQQQLASQDKIFLKNKGANNGGDFNTQNGYLSKDNSFNDTSYLNSTLNSSRLQENDDDETNQFGNQTYQQQSQQYNQQQSFNSSFQQEQEGQFGFNDAQQRRFGHSPNNQGNKNPYPGQNFNTHDNRQNNNSFQYQNQTQGNFGQYNNNRQPSYQPGRSDYFAPKPRIKLQVGHNIMHAPRSSYRNSNQGNFNGNSTGQFVQQYQGNFRDQSQQQQYYQQQQNLQQYQQSVLQQQQQQYPQNQYQQQNQFEDNNYGSQQSYQGQQYSPNKPFIPYQAKTLGVQKQVPSQYALQKARFSSNEQTPQKPKMNEPCHICKGIPSDRVINKNCNHIGCLSCFMKYKSCSCGEKCTRKDLEAA